MRLARIVYPYWRERRIERNGRPIIPHINVRRQPSHLCSFDSSCKIDDSNEGDSYICFRRRDVKPIRKTRKQDTASVDRMVRLKAELNTCLDLAKLVTTREDIKREFVLSSLNVWDTRINLVDLKRKFALLGSREDEELLLDKERPAKKSRPSGEFSGAKFVPTWRSASLLS